MAFAGCVNTISAIFLSVMSSFGRPLYHEYPLISKFLRMAGNPQKPLTLNPAKIKVHTVPPFYFQTSRSQFFVCLFLVKIVLCRLSLA